MPNEAQGSNSQKLDTKAPRPWYRIHLSTVSILAIVLALLVFINIPGDRTSVTSDRYSHGWPYHYYERGGPDSAYWSFAGTSPVFKVEPLILNALVAFCIAALVACACELWIRHNVRLFRFSLRSMFFMTTALAVIMGLGVREVHQCYRQDQTLRELAEVGSVSTTRRLRKYDWFRSMFGQDFEGTITAVAVISARPTYVPLPDLASLQHVKSLTFENIAPGAFDVDQLANLPKLQFMSVKLTEHGASDAAALRALTAFPKLQYLRLSGDSFTDETVDQISPDARIHRLSVGSTKISSAGLMSLSRHTWLLFAWFDKSSLAKHDLAVLARIPNLHLTIIDNKLTAKDEERLRTVFQNFEYEGGKTADTGEKYISFHRDQPFEEFVDRTPARPIE